MCRWCPANVDVVGEAAVAPYKYYFRLPSFLFCVVYLRGFFVTIVLSSIDVFMQYIVCLCGWFGKIITSILTTNDKRILTLK